MSHRFVIAMMFYLGGVAASVCAAEPPREIAVGDWSPAVTDNRGYAVRGRLVLAEKSSVEDLRDTVLYVELQDASEHVGSSMRIFFDLSDSGANGEGKTGLSCRLVDQNKRPVPFTSPPFDGRVPTSQWIELPSDATIRVRTSPFGIRHANAVTIAPHVGQVWVIQESDPGAYFLSGTFTTDPEEGKSTITDPQIWRGTLELPAMKIVSHRSR